MQNMFIPVRFHGRIIANGRNHEKESKTKQNKKGNGLCSPLWLFSCFLWMWMAFTIISPLEIFVILALLRMVKSIKISRHTLRLFLWTMISCFYSLQSASVHWNLWRIFKILPVCHFLYLNSIWLYLYATSCSATTQLMAIPWISSSWTSEKEVWKMFLYVWFFSHFIISLAYSPRSIIAGSMVMHIFVDLWSKFQIAFQHGKISSYFH